MKLPVTILWFTLLVIFGTMSVSAQYVGSSKSNKYHELTCRHAKKITDENKVEFKTVQEAADADYVACKVCKPGGETVTTKDPPKADSESSGRCQATTKKGTQCKRNAQAGSKYCWQHAK